ncbi:MAG: T9SS type A sorting domain-containing protein [Ignavibacteria bacterium]|nr:T9SS type A sorting domain-containing protein [Ignavibacteria bacterium]HEX2960687.1 T9SS type A sorting domain-containing protein [Ignavibacteriales bacterium]MCU7498539.1 T9SS type A sorting domain-containing protein [Ignavibacteria bacterium]MCU7511660.1 T9SS type A sorting domain-containing protein [Ignavibacteria bacterium]MCU7519126.1 T9SS type A sorting domain-containing protein [Ignavibacteria bacterium]
MRKIYSFLLVTLVLCGIVRAQNPITMQSMSVYNAAFSTTLSDSIKTIQPYGMDLGVRRVIVADANKDGKQEIIATDYSNGGRVHVIAPSESDPSVLEVIWSSPALYKKSSTNPTPRFPQVGDCDGDGNPEIIFERYGDSRIVFYEWNPDTKTWGSDPSGEPDFYIDDAGYKAAGSLEALRLTREDFLVKDIDGDGKSEIIGHGGSPGRDVYILGVDGDIPASFGTKVVIEGGDPTKTMNGRNWVGGSYWNTIPADIDGDGKLELVNHHWDMYGFWSIDVNGHDSYTYPDTNNVNKKSIYTTYGAGDAVSYFGAIAADVNGDGRKEIVGTKYGDNFDVELLSFTKADTGVYIWKSDSLSKANRAGVIASKKDLAALAGKTAAEFWPCVKGDLNKDGKDEIYTGGGTGLNLIAIQYKGQGSLTDSKNYTSNLVYTGAGGGVYAKYKIYHGQIDTIITATDTTYKLNTSKIDTVREEVPFTSYIFADSVDLNHNGKMEIVLSEQSVYDSITVENYAWVDSLHSWALDGARSKIINPYRKTIRVLEYTGATGVRDQNYSIVFPEDYKLEQNYPNPFNPTTTIRFTLPIDKKISLKIYDMLGKEVASLVQDQLYKKGKYDVMWNGMTSSGQHAASGNYIARLVYGNYSQSIKMTLLK